MRQYEREDIDYDTWYSDWMKRLAKQMSVVEIERALGVASKDAEKSARSHLRAIEATASMSSNSQRRAHARNSCAAAGEYKIALSGAMEIHELFPEFAKRSDTSNGPHAR